MQSSSLEARPDPDEESRHASLKATSPHGLKAALRSLESLLALKSWRRTGHHRSVEFRSIKAPEVSPVTHQTTNFPADSVSTESNSNTKFRPTIDLHIDSVPDGHCPSPSALSTDVPHATKISSVSPAVTGTPSGTDTIIASQSSTIETLSSTSAGSGASKSTECRALAKLADTGNQSPTATTPPAQDVPASPARIVTTLASQEYQLHCFNRELGLYYSLNHWPQTHPRLGDGKFLIERLARDLLRPVTLACKKKHIPLTDTAINPDLRLSGRVSPGQDKIELHPTVWINCTSKPILTLVKNALKEPHLTWLSGEHIEVHDSLRFNKRTIRIEGLDLSRGFRFAEAYRIHLHIKDPGYKTSACGLVLCTTITTGGNIVDQWVSRLGGLLDLDGAIYASSTAHGILDILLASSLDPPAKEGSTDTAADTLGPEHKPGDHDATNATDSKPESGGSYVTRGSDIDRAVRGLPKSGDSRGMTEWHPIPNAITFDFIQAALPDTSQTWSLSDVVRPHDFALFDLGEDLREKLQNSYVHNSSPNFVDRHLEDESLPGWSQEVSVLLGHDTTRGRILPGSSTIFMAGVEFSTKKIIVERPLAPGTSGSWVAYDCSLCGTVIASYESERIAHIITAQKLFHDIKTSLPKTRSVRVPKLQVEMGTNIEADDHDGRTPLHRAAEMGREADVRALVHLGADKDAKDRYGKTPLYIAAENGHKAIVRTLVELETDKEAKNRYMKTLLHLAAKTGHEAVIRILIELGADKDGRDWCRRTPLHLAAENGHELVVKTLVELGANKDMEDGYTKTPLHLAAETGHEAVVKTLVELGANKDAKDMYGETPLYYAAKMGHEGICKILTTEVRLTMRLP
ncbi:hypothetical protein DL771_006511 [Monosporascus sp. 5C6A]|nr:hypothetical protein DL771_006511 [Monosporascus sp. 5C6A]